MKLPTRDDLEYSFGVKKNLFNIEGLQLQIDLRADAEGKYGVMGNIVITPEIFKRKAPIRLFKTQY